MKQPYENKAGKLMKKKMIGAVLLSMLLMTFTGCGDKTAEESMSAETQNEQTDEIETTEVESSSGEVMMDEATRQALTTELLEENNMDTSVVDSTKKTRGCTFTLPEEFMEAEDMPGMYVTKRYPIDASTIYYIEMDKDISIQLMTEETFLAQAQEQFVENGELDVEVSLDSFERLEIDGYPAFRIMCSYELDGVEFTHLEYVINADKSYIITYSQTSEYDRMEAFEASAATIKVEHE